MTAGLGCERVAHSWSRFVRSGGDVLFERNFGDFLDILPPPGRLVIDVGCGEGRVDRRLMALGYGVVGVDASETLVRLAREHDPRGDYRVADATRLPFADRAADLVVSFMTLHDVSDLDGALREAARALETAGALCLTIVHPVASGGDFESADDDARFVLDSYFPSRVRRAPLLDDEVEQFHRPLETYVSSLHRAGFVVEGMRETPTARRASGRVPMFLHLRARKVR